MPASGAEVYSDLVKTLLDNEAARKGVLESKGTAVITTSGTLVTLLFGLVAVITSAKNFNLPSASHGWLVAAVVAFVIAVGLAILVSLPVPYGETEISMNDLRSWWHDPVTEAEAAVAGLRLRAITAARRANGVKVWILGAACVGELLGLVLLSIAVIEIIGHY